jgi:UDP-N-acetylmuramoyl-tripeptide--D-alanyl-D-alanine ligase
MESGSTEPHEIRSQLIGIYNFENILSAICIGRHFAVSPEQIRSAIESYIPSNNRSQLVKLGSNTIILDAYNANPTSMRAAIENLTTMSAGNKIIAVLGEMAELGRESEQEHAALVEYLKTKNIDGVFLVGAKYLTQDFPIFTTIEQAIYHFKKLSPENHLILIKGSRSMKMEKLLEALNPN